MRNKEKILYIALACVAVVVIAFLAVGVFQKNQDLNEAKATNTQNQATIEEHEKKIAGLEEELKKSETEKEKLKTERDSANAEKDKLQKENSNLKKEIENLKLKKQQSAQTTIKKPAVQTKPATKKPVVIPSSSNKVCYLTFDDGPTARTLEILKILKDYNVKATFFVINTSNFDYLKQIKAGGHAIGLHAYNHNYAKIYKSTTAYFNDLQAISDKVYKVTGERPNIMRFPGGSSNVVSRNYCKGIMSLLSKEVPRKGFAYFDWNVDSDDAGGSGSSYTRIVSNVLAGSNGKNSICVLMHDAAAKTATVQALPKIIEGLAARGFRFDVLTNNVTGFKHGVNN